MARVKIPKVPAGAAAASTATAIAAGASSSFVSLKKPLPTKLPNIPAQSSKNSEAMSSGRARASSNKGDDLIDLVLKLQSLLPNNTSHYTSRVPASQIIEETCNYIKRLQSEADELGEKLSQILASLENNGVDVTSVVQQ